MKREKKTKCLSGLMRIFISVIIMLTLVSTVSAEYVSFSQLDINLGDSYFQYTDWGAVDFTFTGQDSIYYFNLSVNSTWQVQNIPVVSLAGTGVEQTMTYFFSLGNDVGTQVSTINYGYSFDAEPLSAMPSIIGSANVVTDHFAIWPGLFEDSYSQQFNLQAAQPLVGGKAKETTKHAISGFPNQEAGKNECVPAAVSNSLKFLKNERGLQVDEDDISIGKMKEAVDWSEKGAPMSTWWETKKKYMEDNEIDVSTRKITDISKLIAEVDAKQDIEVIESWLDKDGKRRGHATALVGITPLEDNRYSIDVVDDRKQGETGGIGNPRTYTYDPTKGTFYEVGFGYSKFEYAIVECPVPEPSSVVILSLGLVVLIGIRRRFP